MRSAVTVQWSLQNGGRIPVFSIIEVWFVRIRSIHVCEMSAILVGSVIKFFISNLHNILSSLFGLSLTFIS